ncbi:MAG: CBS domain-containing protein [Anaerovoracaceae bacterium]
MKVKDLMSTNISCIKENTSVLQIAKQMKKENIGSIPICSDQGYIKGIVTDRDLVLRALAADKENIPISSLTARDIMSLNPVTVSPETNTHDAALLFSANQIRRLPVTENSKLVGMLSLGDLASKPVCIDEAGDVLSAVSINPGAV